MNILRYTMPIAFMPFVWACGSASSDKSTGIWAGEMKLCADTVVNISRHPNWQTGAPMLRIGLRDDARKRFANMTRTMVGKPMEVRFEGRVLMAPIIAEPITGGSIDIDDPGSGRGADLLTQLTAPC